jgi:hypothetical protein
MEQLEEIRINSKYTSRLIAEYQSSMEKEKESKPTIRRSIMRTNQYIEKFARQFNSAVNDNSLIPPNCRFIKSYPNDRSIVIVEEAPAMRSIRVKMDMTRDREALRGKNQWKEFGYENFFEENKSPYTFMLAIPYVIHVLEFAGTAFSSGLLYFRPKPLLGMSDILYRPPLLNISNGMSVCYGNSVYEGPKTSISSEIDHVLRVFWSSVFNPDYIDNYYRYSEVAGLCDYFTWQYYSQTNPMFIYTADWIASKKTINRVIEYADEKNSHVSQELGYKNLSKLFNKPQVSSKTLPIGKLKILRNLVYDVCNGWAPELDLPVYIGDPIKYTKDRIAFVDCFIGIAGRNDPTHVRIKADDKLITFKITQKVKEFLAKKIKEVRHESFIELPDKTLLKSGDIITMKNNFGVDIYKKLHYIRKAVDDKIEIRIGSEYWFFDAVDWSKISKIDVSKPIVDGIEIVKDVYYKYFISAYYPPAPISNAFRDVKYYELSTGNSNNLVVKLRTNDGESYDFSLNKRVDRTKKLYDISKMEDVPEVFFIGRSIISYTDERRNPISIKRDKEFGLIASSRDIRISKTSFHDICKHFLNKEKTSFHAESNNLIIDFSIDDKVIVSNWEDPLSMLSIKTIKGFILNNDARTINFLLEDKHGNASSVLYVHGDDCIINVGKIRKVTNVLNDVMIGTKIIAKESGISCFPKKDVNIIVAFIIDTEGEPLVLCSNGCTLWFSDLMEKFQLIKIKSPKWKKLTHASLDPSKIKLQTGDVVNSVGRYSSNRGFLVTKNSGSGGLKFARLDYYHDYDEYVEAGPMFINKLILDCIPNPRMTTPKQKLKGFVSGFPTFHGGVSFTESNYSHYKFIDETRRF